MKNKCSHCGKNPQQRGYSWCSVCLETLKRSERKLHHTPQKPFVPKLGSPLSPRQKQILGLMLEGLSITEISVALGLSDGTISEQKRRIMARTGATNDVQIGVWAARNSYSIGTSEAPSFLITKGLELESCLVESNP